MFEILLSTLCPVWLSFLTLTLRSFAFRLHYHIYFKYWDTILVLKSRSGRDNFQIIITPSSYSTCPGLSIKWTGRRLVIDSGTKCAWVIHESKAVQIHLHHSNRRCLYVPRVPGSVKNPHNINCLKIGNSPFYHLLMCLKYCCMYGKQGRP